MFPYDKCPNCGASLQSHKFTSWCTRCGWARNVNPDPLTGKPVETPGRPMKRGTDG